MRRVFKEFDFLEVVDSTSAYLRRYVDTGVERAARAAEQTAGRGRQGRPWFSPPGEGLYVSYLLFPNWDPAEAASLNEVAALAVVESVRQLSEPGDHRLGVKLPNDVLIDGRKVAGILVELSTLPKCIHWAIIGIGVNLLQKSFPENTEFHVPPTSLFMEGMGEFQPSEFCELLTENLERLYLKVDREGTRSVQELFREALLET